MTILKSKASEDKSMHGKCQSCGEVQNKTYERFCWLQYQFDDNVFPFNSHNCLSSQKRSFQVLHNPVLLCNTGVRIRWNKTKFDALPLFINQLSYCSDLSLKWYFTNLNTFFRLVRILMQYISISPPDPYPPISREL